jgi:hypothetical protein
MVVKKILITTVLFFFCLSSANAFLAKTKEIDPEDYPFLLLAKDLQVYNIKLDLSGSAEKARIKKWINGVYDIKYEYDRRDSDDFNALFFSVKLEIEKNKKEAKETYREGLAVITKTSAAVGMPCREIKNTIKWGDENYYAVREKNGSPVGLIFKGRLNNKVYTIIMAGLYSSDHSLITDLVIPRLQNIDDFQVKE